MLHLGRSRCFKSRRNPFSFAAPMGGGAVPSNQRNATLRLSIRSRSSSSAAAGTELAHFAIGKFSFIALDLFIRAFIMLRLAADDGAQ